jgi:hypothetical protein
MVALPQSGHHSAAACNATVVQKGGSRLYGLIRAVAGALLPFAYDEGAGGRQRHGLALSRALADLGELRWDEHGRFRARQATFWEAASLRSARVTVSPITNTPKPMVLGSMICCLA